MTSTSPGASRPRDGRAALPPGRSVATGPPARSAPRVPAGGAVSRVTVLAPSTRIDVAVPADVPVADLVPVLVEMAGEAPRRGADSTAAPGSVQGWTLAPLGQAPVDPAQTLDGLAVLDGDQLVLRRRAGAAPAPLYDDVVDAVAEATPASYRAWDPAAAARLGRAAAGSALAGALAALVVAGRGPGTADGVVTAVVAAVVAVVCVSTGTVLARVAGRGAAGAVLAVGGVGAAAVAGVAAVPPVGLAGAPVPAPLLASAGAPHLLLGAVVALVAAAAGLLGAGPGSRGGAAALLGLATAAALAALTGAGATVAGALLPSSAGPDAAAVAAAAGAIALVALAALPRTGVALARLPMPAVPSSAEDLAADPGPTEHADLQRRADRAHATLTGLVAGTAAVVVAAVAVLGAAPAEGLRGVAGWALATLLVVLLALRSRTYANAVHAVVLLGGAVLAGAGALAGWITASAAGAAALGVVAAGLAAAGLALLLGEAVPGRRFSPVARRAVDIGEAVGIAAVLPLALGVMDLYTVVRLL